MDKHALILKYIPLAHKLAKVYYTRFPRYLDEYKAAARLGLVQAANQFNPSKNTRFSTFAKRRIRGAIIDMHRSLDLQGFRRTTGQRPRIETVDDYAVYDTGDKPDAALESEDFMLHIISKVSDKQYPVLKGIYVDHKSLKSIATELGVTLNRVSYLHRTGLERLRRLLGAGVS